MYNLIVRFTELAVVASLAACSSPSADSSGGEESGASETDETTPGDDETSEGAGETDATDVSCIDDPGFAWAPEPQEIGGVSVAAMDIEKLSAQVTFDLNQGRAQAESQVDFQTLDVGAPVFDLRQVVDAVVLDGEDVDLALLQPRLAGQVATVMVLDQEVSACDPHRLELSYDLGLPNAPSSRAPSYSDGRLNWDFDLSDVQPGRFLEQWFPASLSYDHFAFELELSLEGATVEHSVITNGVVEALGEAKWRISWSDRSTAMSPMLVVGPASAYESRTTSMELADGRPLDIEVWKEAGASFGLAQYGGMFSNWVRVYEVSQGPWLHDGRFTIFIVSDSTAMEYDAGTITRSDQLLHEVFHSWWARGIKPPRQDDGWIDEAWDSFHTYQEPAESPFDFGRSPVTLFSNNIWNRTTPNASYVEGARLFEGVADRMGLDRLQDSMRELYLELDGGQLSTERLMQHLYCVDEDPVIIDAFLRFVYGRTDTAPPAPEGYCG